MKLTIRLIAIHLLTLAAAALAEPQAITFSTPAERLAWWQSARFGMFIHWGPVSIKGTEIGWSRGSQVPIEEYDNLYKQFNPTRFDADAWVRVARTAGMKYMVLTTKHHDGFCLWNTRQTDYNIMKSPFARDVVKELSEACKRQGIAFGTYYSVCDWHHPDFPMTSPGGSVRRPQSNLDRYTEYLKNQVGELLTNYGPLCTLWFDVPQAFDSTRGQGVINHVRSLQPDILINNRTGAAGDYETPEQQIGGFNNTRPWETCMTICNQWAWKPNDGMKPLAQCIRTLVQCTGGDGNLLFNVGPTPLGEIEGRQIERLQEMGAWLGKYGESIYETRGGPYFPGAWGASTRRGNRVYLHVFSWPKNGLVLAGIPRKVVSSTVLTGGTATVTETPDGLAVQVPEAERQEMDTIVRLELDGSAMDLAPQPITPPSMTFKKPASASNVFQKMSEYAADKAVDENPATRWATDGGTKQAWLQIDMKTPASIGKVAIEESYAGRVQKFELQYKPDANAKDWQTIFAGTTLGEGYVREFPPVNAAVVRLNILDATEGPTLSEFRLYAK